MRLLMILGTLVFTACTTGMNLPHCDEAIQTQVETLGKDGFRVVFARDAAEKEGIIIMGQFLNPQKEEGIISVVVDTETLSDFFLSKNFKKTGSCQRGGKEWFLLSRREKVVLQKN